MSTTPSPNDIRARLVAIALDWEVKFGVAPAITSAISEYDAATLMGLSPQEYSTGCTGRTAVSRGHDFLFQGKRYQVKANRPSGKRGSDPTLTGKPRNFDWDFLIWIRYDTQYQIKEAWLWSAADYQAQLAPKKYVRPPDLRAGTRLFPPPPT
jgi:hypothetical protein